MSKPAIVLASGSVSRRMMLEAAGVNFTTAVPGVDEDRLKDAMMRDGSGAAAIADALAEAKALTVSRNHPHDLVIGSDQVLICDGLMFNKCFDEAEARKTLLALRGREHELISSVVIARNAMPVWKHRETAKLTMRNFSQGFLDEYLSLEMPEALGSVGVYRIEGRGAQLFSSVEGNQFCIRGLPLIAVLSALREHGALLS